MEHIRIFVDLGFWSPCILSKVVTTAEATEFQTFGAIAEAHGIPIEVQVESVPTV